MNSNKKQQQFLLRGWSTKDVTGKMLQESQICEQLLFSLREISVVEDTPTFFYKNNR